MTVNTDPHSDQRPQHQPAAVHPAPVVSDIPAAQPQPTASLPPVNGAASTVASGVASTDTAVPPPSSAPVVPSSAPTAASPSASALTRPQQPVSYPAQPSTAPLAPQPARPPPQPQPVPQYYEPRPVPSSYPPPPPPPPLPRTFVAQPVHRGYSPHSQSAQPAYQTGYQPQPVAQPVQPGYISQSARPLIVDPPRRRSMALSVNMPPAKSSSAAGYPSPTRDYRAETQKFGDDLSRNVLAIKQSVPEAVRQAVRDNWEKCLTGSEFHQAFILNASLHHSRPSVQSRAVHDFGADLVSNCKNELIHHFSPRDIDDVAELILGKASNAFLDKALEMRLATIDAKPLIHALARAERLGYDSQDLVEVAQGEHVIPNGATQIPGHAVPVGPTGGRAARHGELQCLRCYRTFPKQSYFDYHMSRGVCAKIPPTADGFRYSCSKCGQGFTHPGGLSYHEIHMVCEPGGGQPSSPANAQQTLPSTPGPITPLPNHPVPKKNITPAPVVLSPSSRPLEPSARPLTITPQGSGPHGDPYGHLTADQRAQLEAELLEAEEQYSGRFREAEAIQDPETRRTRLESLRNTFGTKQSMIRKKYGVRLRERRTRAEIQAERERMGRTDKFNPGPKPGTPGAVATPGTGGSSGWTAANRSAPVDLTGDSPPSLKRRRLDNDNNDNPSYNTPYAGGETTKVSEMSGGLGASSTAAALQDPTLPPPASGALAQPARTYEQSGARVEIHMPNKSGSDPPSASASAEPTSAQRESREFESSTPEVMEVDSEARDEQHHNGVGDARKGEKTNGNENQNDKAVISLEDDDSDSDDDSSEEGIPPAATLPANVRQSLTPHHQVRMLG